MVIPSALCLAIAASSIAATPRDASKVVLISWDVAPNWVIREMVDAGKLPGLARIAAAGFRSDGMQPAYPSKTAVGHASIFMGTWPDIHGVSNNPVPLLRGVPRRHYLPWMQMASLERGGNVATWGRAEGFLW